MKKIITIVFAIGIVNFSIAQIKTTGVVTIPNTYKPMTIKLDMYKGQSLLVMTVTGPADRLFCIGFGSDTMAGTGDSVTATKDGAYTQLSGGTVAAPKPYIPAGGNVLLDTKGFTGPGSIQVDAGKNDWKVISDDGDLSSGRTVRTIVAARPLNTGNSTEDYAFDFDNLANLNIIWAMWRDTAGTASGADDGLWALSGKNTVGSSTRHNDAASLTRGTTTVNFIPTGGKSSGVVTLTPEGAAKPMTLKLDMDQANSRVYMTVTGPADRMFYIGFGGPNMSNAADAVAITKLGACDQLAGGTLATPVQYIPPGANAVLDTKGFTGHSATTKDLVNDWIVLSDDGDLSDPTKTIRSVLAFRALNTNSTEGDYVFDYDNLTNLNVIWEQGQDYVPKDATYPPTNPNSPDNGYWALSGKNTIGITTRHGSGNLAHRGSTVLSFSILGIADNAYSEKLTISPNPAKNRVNVLVSESSSFSTIRIFDINAKLLKTIQNKEMSNALTVDISNLRTGIYFMEISNDKDRTVKKIIKE